MAGRNEIIATGFSGLIGSRLRELLSTEFEITDLSKETGIDITDYDAVKAKLQSSKAQWVWHLAAYTDVQAAEKEQKLGRESLAWKINVEATVNLVNLCRELGKRLLYLSTDYVFAGDEKEPYSEEDQPSPQGWYAQTKYEGEKAVSELGKYSLIIRTANPYRANPLGKRDFVHKMLDRLRAGQVITAPADQLFMPTWVDDLAMALKVLIENNSFGIYHVAGKSVLSPLVAAQTIAQVFGLDASLVQAIKFTEFMKNRAPFPRYAVLKTAKIGQLGVGLHTFEEGLRCIKEQEKMAGGHE